MTADHFTAATATPAVSQRKPNAKPNGGNSAPLSDATCDIPAENAQFDDYETLQNTTPLYQADAEGFEPPVSFHPRRFSRPVP